MLLIVLMELNELEEAMEEDADTRLHKALDKRAPNLSLGTGRWRDKRLFGSASNYAQDPIVNPLMLTGGEYYSCFRFAREHIPRLVTALGLPRSVVLPNSHGRLDGDEAFLIFLRTMAYPSRRGDHFFGRSPRW